MCCVFLVRFRALTQMKIRLKGAEKGHSLLKKKSDALTMRFRQILAKIIEVIMHNGKTKFTKTVRLSN